MTQQRNEEILNLHAQGISCYAISKALSIHTDTVKRCLVRAGHTPTPAITATSKNPSPIPDPEKLNRNAEPMRIGHPTAINALWKGLERWRNNTATGYAA